MKFVEEVMDLDKFWVVKVIDIELILSDLD